MTERDDELTLREVVRETDSPGERIEESAIEVASLALGAGGMAFGAAQAYYSRASYDLQRNEAAARAAERAEFAELQRQLYQMRRMQAFERGGLTALDEFDEWHYGGPFTGFGDY